jgi:pyrroline-5-carboxylate reductase
VRRREEFHVILTGTTTARPSMRVSSSIVTIIGANGTLGSALTTAWRRAGRLVVPCTRRDVLADTVRRSSFVVVATKPHDAAHVFRALARVLTRDQMVLSAVAGTTPERVSRLVHPAASSRGVACFMPNLACVHRQSHTMVATHAPPPPQQAQQSRQQSRHQQQQQQQHQTQTPVDAITLLSELGAVAECTTDQLFVGTALVGSGPAFMQRIIDDFVRAACANGMEHADAVDATLDMIDGSVALIRNVRRRSGVAVRNVCRRGTASASSSTTGDLDDLTSRVATPGGTTAAGLACLSTTIPATIDAATTRARELSSQFETSTRS